jgi:phosphoribosylaminoimidazole-succinocarboxamide synthase
MPTPEAPFQSRADRVRFGKVRDIYTFRRSGATYVLLVATDRISVYDVVLPTEIPDKGRVLTALSSFWFGILSAPHHCITTNLRAMAAYDPRIEFGDAAEWYDGRTMLCMAGDVIPFECVVRGYLVGSGWKEYQQTGAVCGIRLPEGLVEAAKLPEPIFTPATKADTGHDENISFEEMARRLGDDALAVDLRGTSLRLYRQGAAHAEACGIILADTKFEFARSGSGGLLLIDEALTPDSSRFWPADQYRSGTNPPSFDKQFVRDFVAAQVPDKNAAAIAALQLPAEIVQQTRAKYLQASACLTGQTFP